MRLIINADDFGLCASVNRAIIDTYLAGNLTSTTLMVAMPGTAEAVALSQQHPGLGIGLHFTLTEGRPLSSAPSLVDEKGFFFKRGTLIKRALSGKINPADIAAEFKAQLNRAREMGIRLTHFDSHQHLHMLPPVFNAILPVAEEAGIRLRLVVPNIERGLLLRRPQKFAKQQLLKWNIRRLSRRVRRARHNDRLVSIHDLPTLPDVPAVYQKLVRPFADTGDIVELMVHPYLPGPDLDSLYPDDLPSHQPFFEKCYAEHRLLTAQPQLFPSSDLITYGDI